jgi:hypothetical protein
MRSGSNLFSLFFKAASANNFAILRSFHAAVKTLHATFVTPAFSNGTAISFNSLKEIPWLLLNRVDFTP